MIEKKEFLRFLHTISSPDEKRRQAAETQIQAWETQATDEFGITLVHYGVDSTVPVAVQKKASAILKQYIEAHWCSVSEKFRPPEIRLESKTKIKELLIAKIESLYSASEEMRNSVANSISFIAHSEWLENGPVFFDTLISYLNNENELVILGVFNVLYTFIEKLTVTQLPHVGPVILQESNRIFTDTDNYSYEVRGWGVWIFAEMVTTISAYKQPALIQQYLEPSIPLFCTEFVQNDLRSNAELGCDILKAIKELTKTLPKCILDFLPKMLPVIWKTLIYSAKVYQKSIINLSENIDNEATGPDGEEGTIDMVENIDSGATDSNVEEDIVITADLDKATDPDENELENINDLIGAVFEFIGILMSGSNAYTLELPEYNLLDYHWFYLQDSLPPEVLHHLIIFIQITDKQMEQSINKPSLFIAEENLIDDSTYPHSMRSDVQELLMKIIRRPERAAVNALLDVILKQIQTGNAMKTSSNTEVNQNWWRLHEASIQVFGLIKDILAMKQQTQTLSFDVVTFLENVVLVNLNNPGNHPLLLGRCLYIGGLYAEQMPLEMKSRFLESTIYSLKNQPVCTRICAAKAANYWLRAACFDGNDNDYDRILRSQLPTLFQELFNLGNQFMSANVLTIVLENFATLASLNKVFTASVVSKICTLAIAAFVNFRSNCLILGICQKIFRELTLNLECVELLQTHLVPTLVGELTVHSSMEPNDEEVQVDALDVLILLVQHSPQPLSNFLIESAFPATCNFVLSSDKYCSLLKAGNVIQTYLSVAAEQVISYKNNDGQTGPRYIIRVAAHLLDSQAGHLLINNVCDIVTLFISKTGATLGENVNQLLSPVFNRMQRVDCRARVRRLLMVCAHFINIKFEAVFTFLSTAKGPNEQCALAFVISDGFCREHEYFDHDDRRTVALTLSKILEHSLMHQDSKLHQTIFHGAEGDAGSAIPVLVKISKLISNELSSDD